MPRRGAFTSEWMRLSVLGLAGWVVACGGAQKLEAPPTEAPKLTLRARAPEGTKPPAKPEPGAVAAPAAVPPTPAPVVRSGIGRRMPNLNRLRVTDGSTCFIEAAGAAACWWGGGVTRSQGPVAAFVDSWTVLTPDGRYVDFPSMKDHPVGVYGGRAERNPREARLLPPVVDVVVLGPSGAGCAIRSADSEVECWSITIVPPPPTPPPGKFVDLNTNGTWVCGLRPSGEVECFAGVDDLDEPLPQPEGLFVQLSEYCGLREDGAVACWSPAPGDWVARVPKLQRIYSSWGSGVCGLDVSGNAGCWGPWKRDVRGPVPVAYEDVVWEQRRACGVLGDRVECWGFSADGKLDPPAELGRYVKDRPYSFGSTALSFDATVPPLPQNKVPVGCKETTLERASSSSRPLLEKLRFAAPHSFHGRLNLATKNRNEPLLYQCGADYQLRWYFVSTYDADERTDFTLTVPSATTLKAFEAKYERLSRQHFSEPNPELRTGNFIHARRYLGGHAIMSWSLKGPTPRSSYGAIGTALLQASMEGVLVTELTNHPAFNLDIAFGGYVTSAEQVSKAVEKASAGK